VKGPGVDAARLFVGGILAGQGVQMLAVTSDDRVIGWCDVVPKKYEMFSHVGVLGMGVLAPYRGRGLGERLARETIARALQAGLEKVELAVFASNNVALHLYRKLGFAVEGVRVRARKLDGEYDDELVMALFPERID
jgi:ribosomal protein S18 acetylase RimI-like enzyme